MRSEFRPNPKKSGRNQFVGSWVESACELPNLPFTRAALKDLLLEGIKSEGKYTHQEVAHWCDKMHMHFLDEDITADMDAVVSIAADVDCQWDLFLINTYKAEELSTLDFSRVRLPPDWFAAWLEQLNDTEQDAAANP